MKHFTVTEDHLKLLRAAFVGWDGGEFGAPAIDCKRPYGNSNVYWDIYQILGWRQPQEENEELIDEMRSRAARLHLETQTALQVILATGRFQAGHYVCSDYGRDWQLS